MSENKPESARDISDVLHAAIRSRVHFETRTYEPAAIGRSKKIRFHGHVDSRGPFGVPVVSAEQAQHPKV